MFIVCEKVKAVDYLHAMKVAEKRVSLVSDLFVVFHHRHKPWHSDYCLVYKHDKENVVNLKKPSNVMSQISENDFSYAKDIFPVFLERFSLERDSFNRFNRGVELHSLSLETDEVAAQILNFWICLEALLITRKGKTHIRAVEDAVDLMVRNHVLRGRIDNLASLLKKWNGGFVSDIEDALPDRLKDSEEEDVVAALVCVEEYEDAASLLLSKMKNQPLLRYKFMRAVKEMQTQKGLRSVIKKASLKCKRDIRRVYRSRNKIVHQGNIGDHNDYVAEVAHHYLDLVLFCIIERKINFNDIRSIDNLMSEMSVSREVHDSYISKCGDDKIEASNYYHAIFGSSA